MSDRLTDPDHAETPPTPRLAERVVDVVTELLPVIGLLLAYCVVGAAAGWLWHQLWSPAGGIVVQHQWYADGDALRDDFSGTGLYVVVAASAGLVLGLVAALTGARRPLVTVLAATAGSVLAAYVMLRVGEGLGPTDPQQLAATADDGTRLPSALRVTSFSPELAFPFGTLVALAVVYTMFPGKTREAGLSGEPRG